MKIGIQGIVRNQSGVNTDNGTCNEIVNIRVKDGQWQLVYQKEKLYSISGLPYTMWYRHPLCPKGFFIGVDKTVTPQTINYIDITQSTASSSVIFTLNNNQNVDKIYHFGEILLIIVSGVNNVSNQTDNIYFLKYDTKNNSYSQLPEIEHGLYSISTNQQDDDNAALKRAKVSYKGSANGLDDEKMVAIAKLRDAVNKIEDDGYVHGHAFFRIAYEFNDGSYFMPTTPFYWYVGLPDFYGDDSHLTTDYESLPFINIPTDTDTFSIVCSWQWFGKPRLKLSYTTEQLEILKQYEGIIKNVVLFMTKPIYDRNINCSNDDLIEVAVGADVHNFVFPYNELKKDFDQTMLFYRVGDFSIKNLIKDTSVTDYYFTADKIGSVNTIETNEHLPVDNFTAHRIFSDVVYEYNSRLHFGDVKVRLNNGFNQSFTDSTGQYVSTVEKFKYFIGFGGTYEISPTNFDPVYVGDSDPGGRQLYQITTLKINNEEKQVIKKLDKLSVYTNVSGGTVNYALFNNIISYPDERATRIDICYLSGTTYFVMKSFELTSHPYLNLAYYMGDYYEYKNETAGDIGIRLYQTNNIILQDWVSFVTFNENYVYSDNNRVQVSFINNPFYYPAKDSYRIGILSNRVIALTSQSQPMSTGQFGYFPIIIFTTEGIYALKNGTEEVLYQSIQPVAQDIVNVNAGILNINGGIIFATDKGLMLLEGRNVIELSVPVEGKPKTNIQSDSNYIDTVTNFDSDISTIDFKEYIKHAILAYDYEHDEIIISNNDSSFSGNYSYIYSLIYKAWYKISERFVEFLNSYPGYMGITTEGIYAIGNEIKPSDGTKALFTTNPFKFDLDALKVIIRTALRFDIDFNELSGGFTSFYLYGSLNKKEWKLISGVKIPHVSVTGDTNEALKQLSIMLRKVRTTARYFIIHFVTYRTSKLNISGIEFDVEGKYGQKIR